MPEGPKFKKLRIATTLSLSSNRINLGQSHEMAKKHTETPRITMKEEGTLLAG